MSPFLLSAAYAALGEKGERTWALSLMLVLFLGVWQPVLGQEVSLEVRQQALNAFHGPDLKGKDGPLAKIGYDLAVLYYAWRAHEQRNTEEAFTAEAFSFPVREGRVTIDATAVRDAVALQDSLEALGLTNSAQAGAVVSGQLPVASLLRAARLNNLRAMRPARPAVREGATQPAPDTAATAAENPASGDAQRLYWIGGAVVLIVGLLFFLLRR